MCSCGCVYGLAFFLVRKGSKPLRMLRIILLVELSRNPEQLPLFVVHLVYFKFASSSLAESSMRLKANHFLPRSLSEATIGFFDLFQQTYIVAPG